jgi:hypothetical protein
MVVAAVLTIGVIETVGAQDLIDDLPYIGGYEITCTWHRGCAGGSKTLGAGLDFDMESGTLLFAAANGTVHRTQIDSGDINAGYGKYVMLKHAGEVKDTVYGHMSNYFAEAIKESKVCPLVPLGYSGNTGDSDGSHLHFEGNGLIKPVPTPSAPVSWRFTPIYGDRSAGQKYTDAQVAPGNTWIHACGAGGCAQDTNAYTVDDIQASTGEFIFDESDWRHEEGGFGYFGTAPAEIDPDKTARFYYRRYSSDPEYTVRWEPDLQETDEAWSIYVFIPAVETSKGFQAARQVKYTVTWWEPVQGGDPKKREDTVIIDQDDPEMKEKNRWVKLSGSGSYGTFVSGPQTYTPLTVELTTERQSGPCSGNGSCGNRRVLADAALFIPSDCN